MDQKTMTITLNCYVPYIFFFKWRKFQEFIWLLWPALRIKIILREGTFEDRMLIFTINAIVFLSAFLPSLPSVIWAGPPSTQCTLSSHDLPSREAQAGENWPQSGMWWEGEGDGLETRGQPVPGTITSPPGESPGSNSRQILHLDWSCLSLGPWLVGIL